MSDSNIRNFMMEMAEHAVNIGPRHGVNLSLQEAFHWLTSAASNAAAANNAPRRNATILDCSPIQPGTPPENILTAQGYAGD